MKACVFALAVSETTRGPGVAFMNGYIDPSSLGLATCNGAYEADAGGDGKVSSPSFSEYRKFDSGKDAPVVRGAVTNSVEGGLVRLAKLHVA